MTIEELSLVIRALKSHRKECCVAIDELKKLIGKKDPAYPRLSAEHYSDIEQASELINRIRDGEFTKKNQDRAVEQKGEET